MSPTPQLFFRIKLLKDFLSCSEKLKNELLQELVEHATDPVIRSRRFRMLKQLSLYESQIINKIATLKTDNIQDFFCENHLVSELNHIVNKSA
jgi:hypothetical protein